MYPIPPSLSMYYLMIQLDQKVTFLLFFSPTSKQTLELPFNIWSLVAAYAYLSSFRPSAFSLFCFFPSLFFFFSFFFLLRASSHQRERRGEEEGWAWSFELGLAWAPRGTKTIDSEAARCDRSAALIATPAAAAEGQEKMRQGCQPILL